jgi:excisionase family DNA binding protein
MKRTHRKARAAGGRPVHARTVSRHSALPAVERPVEVPLPPALNTERVRRHGGVALVDVEGQRLKLRFLRSSLADDASSTLTAPEEAALAQGGVGPVSADEMRVVEAEAAAAYQQLRAESLDVEEAARRLGVNASRIRQRLAEGALYGVKDGNAWRLPAFQFVANGLVPGIEVVLRKLPEGLSPLAVARWLALPNPDLTTRGGEERPLSPRQWLLEGNPPEPAAQLAAAL